jgi:Cyclin, C-terminal domain/Cyclin, N-terminal domain
MTIHAFSSFDILDCLFDVERYNPIIKKRSDQLEIRPMLIDLLKKFAKQQEYSQATLHLGIYILDVYMDNYILSDFPDHQKLIAIVGLLLAAKSEDLDELVPSIKDILRFVDMSEDLGVDLRFRDELDPKDVTRAFKNFACMYCKLEFLIFESMEFNTIRPTAVSFLSIFQNIVVTSADVVDGRAMGDLRVSANEHIQEFMDVIVQDIDFFNIRPSELAAAVIASTRKLLKIEDYWNIQLEHFTRYKIDAIRPLILVLMEKRVNLLYETSCTETDVLMKDSGYISPDSGSQTEDEDVKHVSKKRKLNHRVPITFGVI